MNEEMKELKEGKTKVVSDDDIRVLFTIIANNGFKNNNEVIKECEKMFGVSCINSKRINEVINEFKTKWLITKEYILDNEKWKKNKEYAPEVIELILKLTEMPEIKKLLRKHPKTVFNQLKSKVKRNALVDTLLPKGVDTTKKDVENMEGDLRNLGKRLQNL